MFRIIPYNIFVEEDSHKENLLLAYLRSKTGFYLFKVKNENTRAMYEICSKLTKKTPH